MTEIMAPAGSFEALRAAIKAGTDSIYFGVAELNMRAASANFNLNNLEEVAKICNDHNVKSYLTVNTVIYDKDIELMKTIVNKAKKANVTAIIACDVAVMQYANKMGVEVHSSTQLNISNIEAVKFYAKYTDVIVLARELPLEQIKYITNQIKEQQIKGPKGDLIEIEAFIHGALCVSISGKCYMSLALYNKSANRGACLQPCRRKYRVIDDETNSELVIDNNFIMSPKDLCTIHVLDRLIDAGIKVLKIEGRARPAEYVYAVVKAYKEAVNLIETGQFSHEKKQMLQTKLDSVYNRGFWQGGYYLGNKMGEWCGVYGSKATMTKEFVGIVKNYFPKNNVAEILVQSHDLNKGDKVLIMGETTGIVQFTVDELWMDDKRPKIACKGQIITIKTPELVRRNDKLYVFKKRSKF